MEISVRKDWLDRPEPQNIEAGGVEEIGLGTETSFNVFDRSHMHGAAASLPRPHK